MKILAIYYDILTRLGSGKPNDERRGKRSHGTIWHQPVRHPHLHVAGVCQEGQAGGGLALKREAAIKARTRAEEMVLT